MRKPTIDPEWEMMFAQRRLRAHQVALPSKRPCFRDRLAAASALTAILAALLFCACLGAETSSHLHLCREAGALVGFGAGILLLASLAWWLVCVAAAESERLRWEKERDEGDAA